MDWKRWFKFAQPEVLGLDIGSSEVKLVQLRKSDSEYSVTAAGTAAVEGAEDDPRPSQTTTVNAIRKCVESAGAGTQMAVCGISGPEAAVRYFNFPALPPEEVKGAVLLEAAQVCPFNIDDSAVDYQIVSQGDSGVRGVLVAATNELIRRKKELAQNAALKCVLMDIDGLALLNCFNGFNMAKEDQHQTPQATAILNVGDSYTTLAIMGDNGLPYIRDITYAGNTIVKDIAAHNKLSTKAVRGILSGGKSASLPRVQLADSLAKACEKLIIDITETLRYYTAQEKNGVVEKIYVCGGFALVKGFVELLDEKLPARAVFWNPFDKVRCKTDRSGKELLAGRGPAMAVAAGLAMRSI